MPAMVDDGRFIPALARSSASKILPRPGFEKVSQEVARLLLNTVFLFPQGETTIGVVLSPSAGHAGPSLNRWD